MGKHKKLYQNMPKQLLQKITGFRIPFLTDTDYSCMILLCFIFALMVFFRLGSFKAPQTYYQTDADTRDIIIDFGEYMDISSLSVFLGNLSTRHLSLSAYNEVTKQWEIINEDCTAESVFDWNKIDIYWNLRYLGIVATDDAAVFNEMVFLSSDDEMILPVNADSYPELFDEQHMFPRTNTYMTGTMFDEVYHGRTAYEFIHHLTTYETTHPHLGKILISVGIRIFGMTPFGWRFIVALFGICITALMYIFAKRLFKNSFIAFATTALFTFDCMHYNLSRIATIDIIAAFFILLMYFFMYEYIVRDNAEKFVLSRTNLVPLGLCGFAMACGIATKWTGVYAACGIAVIFFIHTLMNFKKKKDTMLPLFGFCCIFFILVPLVIYTLSFIPVVGHTDYKNLVDKTIQGSISMFKYHSGLVAEHYYSSPFYEWPVIWMPLLDANDAVDSVRVSSISCMGNPAVWWVGIPCIFFTLWKGIQTRDRNVLFLFIAYAAQYIPWFGISRITFIYHYFPSVLFVILMIGYTMNYLLKHYSWAKKAITAYLVIAVLTFILFFPVISGLPVSREWGMHLRLLPDWILVL